MKAKDFIKLFSEYPDFDVVVSFYEEDYEGHNIIYLRKLETTGIYDIRHLDKKIVLDVRESLD